MCIICEIRDIITKIRFSIIFEHKETHNNGEFDEIWF